MVPSTVVRHHGHLGWSLAGVAWLLSWLQLSFVCGKVQKSGPKDVSAEATEGESCCMGWGRMLPQDLHWLPGQYCLCEVECGPKCSDDRLVK